MCEWRSALDRSYRCRVSSEPSSDYCIFHQREPKDVKRFNAAIQAQLNKEGLPATRNPPFSFVGYSFPKGILVSKNWEACKREEACLPDVLRNLSFSEGFINGDLFLSGAKIEGQADLCQAQVQGNLNFVDAEANSVALQHTQIEGDALFWLCRVGHLYLQDAQIRGNLNFDNAEAESVALKRAQIEGNASFQLCKVGDVYLQDAQIRGNLSFDNAELKGSASLSDTVIDGKATFTRMTSGGSLLLHGVAVHKAMNLLRANVGGSIHFGDARIHGDLVLQEASIAHRVRLDLRELGGKLCCMDCAVGTSLWMPATDVAVRAANFDGCSAKHLNLKNGTPRILGWGKARCGVRIDDNVGAVSFWRFAQRTYINEGKRQQADISFYFERVARWKELRSVVTRDRAKPAKRALARTTRWWYCFLWLLDVVFLRWTTAYGASLARLIGTWFFVIGGFGIVYSLAPRLIAQQECCIWTLRNWINGIHYSATTFATLGLGDFTPGPSSLGKALTSLEALLGAILIALTVLVIGRRFMR